MSLQAALLDQALRRLVRPRLARLTDPAAARRDFDIMARLFLWPPRGARLDPSPVTGGLRADPPGPGGPGAILYFHGGGYVAGSPATHRGLIARLAAAAGLPVHAPAYRLAPEHPLPAALDDARAAWDALVASGLAPARIALGGDSAGGGLALSLLADLCRAGTPPAAAFAFSPWTDLTGSAPSLRAHAATDALLPAARFRELAALARGGLPADDPRASPLFAAFPACPPVLLFAATGEILRDDAVRMATRLGPAAVLRLEPGLPHAWPVFGRLPEAMVTIGETAAFVRAALDQRAGPKVSR